MCDYSLHTVASRPAKIGDQLVTTEFWNTTTRGFSPVGEPKVAVCLLPGTEVAFESEVPRQVRPGNFRASTRRGDRLRGWGGPRCSRAGCRQAIQAPAFGQG
jgi:hypothetical protein